MHSQEIVPLHLSVLDEKMASVRVALFVGGCQPPPRRAKKLPPTVRGLFSHTDDP